MPKFSAGRQISLFIALALLVGILASMTLSQVGLAAEPNVYERVINSGKIRVGYVTQPPAVMKDPNTGKLSGVFAETLIEAAKNLNLEVEWVEEVSWGTMIEGLLADRYDIVCTQVWPNASRAVHADFSVPLYYVGVGAYVKKGDDRFAGQITKADAPDFKVAAIDGEMSSIIAAKMFPKAQKVSLPQLTDVSQMLLQVAQGKADMTFAMTYDGERFLKSNPGTIENITVDRAIQIFPNTYMFRHGQFEFKAMINAALTELINRGFVDALNDKYEEFAGALYRVALPYRPSPLINPK